MLGRILSFESRLGQGLVAWIGVLTLIAGVLIIKGVAGKVEKGPSCTDRLLGGLPRSFPVVTVFEAGQALDTAGPCLFRTRLGGDFPAAEEGFADFGSSNEGLAE